MTHMFFNITNTSVWPCLHLIRISPLFSWNPVCISCRIGGTIILFISIICLIFNIRYLIWHYQKQRHKTHVLSLFVASLLVLTITVPGELLQLFTCHRNCNQIYCRIEGFVSFLCGCFCMLLYMILSINRYLILCQYHQTSLYRYSTVICWFLSICWTLPPAFVDGISYVPEGLGFHCSLNWTNQSKISHLYILFSFIGIYLLPLIVLFSVNLRIHQTIRNIYSSQSSFYVCKQLSSQLNSSSLNRQGRHFQRISNRRSSTTICQIRQAADRKRFRIEYRSIKAIIFLVVTYILSWTPYAIIALFQLFNTNLVFQHAFLITLSAFIAKLSVISAPLVYLSIMHYSLFKKLLFQK